MAKTLAVIMVVLFLSPAAFSAEITGVGFVDLQRALNDSEAGKRSKEELEALVKEKQGDIDKLIVERNRLQREFDRQSSVLSEEAARKRLDEIDRVQREIDRRIADSNEEVQSLQREKEMAILKSLDALITEIGEKEGYTLILPSDVILYSAEGMDITDLVIKRYNAMLDGPKAGGAKEGGGAAPAAPAPAEAPATEQPAGSAGEGGR